MFVWFCYLYTKWQKITCLEYSEYSISSSKVQEKEAIYICKNIDQEICRNMYLLYYVFLPLIEKYKVRPEERLCCFPYKKGFY